MRSALIVGSSGQDGSILMECLTQRGERVLGLNRGGAYDPANGTTTPLLITDCEGISKFISEVRPDRVYYLAAHHHSSQEDTSPDDSLLKDSTLVHVLGLETILHAIARESRSSRLFYAGSSHMFGNPKESPQNENTRFEPTTVYGKTKLAGADVCKKFREVGGLFCSIGILYNHESPLRASRFVSKKIVEGAVSIYLGRRHYLELGNIDHMADWGYAPDYVEAMIRILDAEIPGDFIVSSGELHTVRDFVEIAFDRLNLDWRRFIRLNPELTTRGNMHPSLFGDSSRLRQITGWEPTVSFKRMVEIMVDDELGRRSSHD